MTKFESKENLLKGIEQHFSQLNSGQLTLEELENLVGQTRELYERALILRFKTYEEKVFGEAKEVLEETSSLQSEAMEPEATLENEIEHINKQHDEEKQELFSDEPILDFDLFDEEEIKPIVLEESVTLHEHLTPIEEAIAHDKTQIQDESFEVDLVESAPEMEIIEMDEIAEPAETPSIKNENPIDSSQENNATKQETEEVFKAILIQDDSMASRLMLSKLDTLIGSFGFNERFQTVQELFGGSNDDFNQALTVLDQLPNFDEAKKQLLFYIHLHKWDLSAQTTIDFIQKIQRRYS